MRFARGPSDRAVRSPSALKPAQGAACRSRRDPSLDIVTGRFGRGLHYKGPVGQLAHSPPEGAFAMRVILIIAALLLVAVSAAPMAFDAEAIRPYLKDVEPFRQYLPQATLALVDSGPDRGVPAAAPEDGRARSPGRADPPRAAAASGKPRRRRNRSLSRDAPGEGPAGRFPDGRHQRLQPTPRSARPPGSFTPDAGACCRSISRSIRCARRRRDRRCRSRPAIRPTNTGWSARIAGSGAVLRRARPPRLEDGQGEAAAVAARTPPTRCPPSRPRRWK